MHRPHRANRRLLTLILVLFILLGCSYALVTPPFEASDELWHYPMVRHLADGNPLPVQVFDPSQAGPWNQEASQPPLYYYLAAGLTFLIDASDMASARQLNPHVDNGVLTADGNTNLAIHDPGADPWTGTLLAVRIVRLFSVLLGAATVYLTYRIASEVAPGRPEVALGAAGLNAFLPMFLFISGSVNNDNLAVPLASLALLLMIRVVTQRREHYYPVRLWEWALIGLVIGLAALTKEGTLGLFPLAFGTAVVSAWQRVGEGPEAVRRPQTADLEPRAVRSRLWSVAGGLILALVLIVVPALLVAGWWYYRNFVLYGDWLGWSAFIAVLGQRAVPASLLQLWGERRGFMMSFWGLFGGVNVPMAAWTYAVLNGVLVLSVFGFALYLARLAAIEWRRMRDGREPFFQRLLAAVERHYGLIVILLFAAAVVYGLIQWATTTWSSQGRLVFTAISAICTLMALGLVALAGLVQGLAKGKAEVRESAAPIALGVPITFLFALAAATPWLWIRPAYTPPAYSGPLREPVDASFGGVIRLRGYELEYDDLRPGDSVHLRLEWEALRPIDRNWSVFVHLNDPVLDQPVAQRDMYPGQGLLATSLLVPGRRLVNDYVLTIPLTAIAPAYLELTVGLYDFATGERLPASSGGDALTLATLALSPREGEYPNPTSLYFERGLELVGFSVEPRRVAAGQSISVITYWRPSQPLPSDFTFFAQIVAEDTTRYAAVDLAPPEATTAWTPGEVYALCLPLTLDPATPPGAYPLIIGLYTRTPDGSFDRLQRVTPDGRLTDDFLTVTRVRVDE